jgi:hypothetical protein
MRLKSAIEATIKLSPNGRTFLRSMSHGCRDTLYSMIEWGNTKANLFGNVNNMMSRFAKRFDQIRFEEAEQVYDMEQYVKIIVGVPGDKKNPGLKHLKTDKDVLDAMSLDLLFNPDWAHITNMKKRNRVGNITQHAELYNWIVDNFVLGDFTHYDISKIAEMGQLCSLDTIKKEAQQIQDTDKKNIPYLYAIIRGVNSRDEALQRKSQAKEDANILRLAKLLEIVSVKDSQPFTSRANALEEWEREKEYLDILRSLDSD